ncbi:hypothetical protein [Nioella ostreopsis]|uniref:hypothetical protein n=1 Tax=Nioella ostreopsis TaxID=2448479 RepID=UPI0013DECDA3|nr:hypothetical protein [Nioella ostreopsis]
MANTASCVVMMAESSHRNRAESATSAVAKIKGENLEWLALHDAGWPFLVVPAGM